MTLFEECKQALSDNFNIIKENSVKDVIAILKTFPFANGNIVWSKIDHTDYDDINQILKAGVIIDEDIFVVADDINIPVFKTNFRLLSENIYDVTALSSKLFIFNDRLILQPLFPTDIIRLGFKH